MRRHEEVRVRREKEESKIHTDMRPLPPEVRTILLNPDSVIVRGVEPTSIMAASRGTIPFTGTMNSSAVREQGPPSFSDLLSSSEAWRAPTEADLNATFFYHGRFRRADSELTVLAGDSVVAILRRGRILAVADAGFEKVFRYLPLRLPSYVN